MPDNNIILKCDNCGHEYADESELKFKLHEIEHLLMRIEPGGMVPAGECTECDALVYPVDTTHDSYQKQAAVSCSPHFNEPPVDLLHAILGIVTEAGELADVVKRYSFYHPEATEIDLVNVSEELGDLLWYIALAAEWMNEDISDIMKRNIAKLAARYPDKFSAEHAAVRDLDKEREVLTDGERSWKIKLVEEVNDLKFQRRQLIEQLRSSIKGVNWEALRDQKAALRVVIEHLMSLSPVETGGLDQGHTDALEGILHLVSTIQSDAAAELGAVVVFGEADPACSGCLGTSVAHTCGGG